MNKSLEMVDLAIITNEPFPVGMAATNRIFSYARSIAKDYVVKVYIFKPTEIINKELNTNSKGEINSVRFEYTNGRTLWPQHKSKMYKIFVMLIGYFGLVVSILKEKPRTVLVYSSDIVARLLLLILHWFMSYKLIIEETEYPKILKKTSNRFVIKLYIRYYKFVDGVLVISNELCDYFKNLNVKDVLVLPMTVDVKRFDSLIVNNTESDYFIYVGGTGGFVRDGVPDIVKGFNLFQKKNRNCKLILVGPIESNNLIKNEIDKYIEKNQLQNKVVFKGTIPSNEIPDMLFNSKGIVMAPPEDFPSGGFPTKLGEFLMSGRPVITTLVSEISHYLNKDNAFLVSVRNPEMISEAMEHIYLNELLANTVGQRGREMAQKMFNVETYKSDLLQFFNLHLNE